MAGPPECSVGAVGDQCIDSRRGADRTMPFGSGDAWWMTIRHPCSRAPVDVGGDHRALLLEPLAETDHLVETAHRDIGAGGRRDPRPLEAQSLAALEDRAPAFEGSCRCRRAAGRRDGCRKPRSRGPRHSSSRRGPCVRTHRRTRLPPLRAIRSRHRASERPSGKASGSVLYRATPERGDGLR